MNGALDRAADATTDATAVTSTAASATVAAMKEKDAGHTCSVPNVDSLRVLHVPTDEPNSASAPGDGLQVVVGATNGATPTRRGWAHRRMDPCGAGPCRRINHLALDEIQGTKDSHWMMSKGRACATSRGTRGESRGLSGPGTATLNGDSSRSGLCYNTYDCTGILPFRGSLNGTPVQAPVQVSTVLTMASGGCRRQTDNSFIGKVCCHAAIASISSESKQVPMVRGKCLHQLCMISFMDLHYSQGKRAMIQHRQPATTARPHGSAPRPLLPP